MIFFKKDPVLGVDLESAINNAVFPGLQVSWTNLFCFVIRMYRVLFSFYLLWVPMLTFFLIFKLFDKHIKMHRLIMQGGPHNHTIGGLAVCLKYAQSPEFKAYQNKVLCFPS